MKKHALSLALSAALISTVVACSKDDSASTEATQEAATTQEAQQEGSSAMATEESVAPKAAEAKIDDGGFAHPESSVSYNGKLYTSNVGAALKPTEKDADGYILVSGEDGSTEGAEKFEVDAYLHAPKGMMVWNDALYVTDVNYIYGFDLNDHSLVFAVEPGLQHPDDPQPQFLNDIVAEDDSSFLVSATDTNTIYRVTNDFVPAIFKLDIDTALKGPNGLAYDAENKKLYIAGWGTDNQPNGELGVVDLNTEPHKYTRLGEHSGHLDGLVKVGDQLIFTDWVDFEKSGNVHSYDLSSGEIKQLSDAPIGGPADINLSADGKSIVLPAMLENKIIQIGLE